MAMAYGYNDAGHLHPVTDIDLNGTNRSFSYDLNGSMTTGYDLADPAAVVSRSITYTADNMPAAIIRGAATTSFIYDDDGRRAKKTAGSNTTVYVNDLYEIVNAAATKYIFAGNLRIARITGTDIKYFHKDHLGSSTVMTDVSGNSVETSEYLPYGGNRDQSGTSVSDYKFTDQELDTSTGLYNYDARLYDPVVGRFVSADSIVPDIYDPRSLNRYSYCLNNPLKYEDPSGHKYSEVGRPLGTYNGLPDLSLRGLVAYGLGALGIDHYGNDVNGKTYSYGPHGVEVENKDDNHSWTKERDIEKSDILDGLAERTLEASRYDPEWGADKFDKDTHNCKDYSKAMQDRISKRAKEDSEAVRAINNYEKENSYNNEGFGGVSDRSGHSGGVSDGSGPSGGISGDGGDTWGGY